MALLVTIPLNQQKKINIYQGSHGKYYNINNDSKQNGYLNNEILNYDIHFPIEWANDDDEYIYQDIQNQVGPRYCYNCIDYGFHNGVFIGYCANCAFLLEYSRGNGLLPSGEEVDIETTAFDLTNIKEENSIWKTYLQTNRNEIGDNSLKENYEMYKDLPPLIDME